MIDLEKFPTSPAAKRMMKTISPVYDKAYVGKWLLQVMGMEIDEAWKFFEELRLQAFPETATWGIVYWEQRYHIPPDDNLTIEERRQRVIEKRGRRSPMNPARVELIIGGLTDGNVRAIENIAPYTFKIEIENKGRSGVDMQSIYNALKQIKPSHLGFEVEINDDAREQELVIQSDMISAMFTELPEWTMDYEFNSNIEPAGTAIIVQQLTLPQIA